MYETEAEAKILSSRPLWPRGLNITDNAISTASSAIDSLSVNVSSGRHSSPKNKTLRPQSRHQTETMGDFNLIGLAGSSLKTYLFILVWKFPS